MSVIPSQTLVKSFVEIAAFRITILMFKNTIDFFFKITVGVNSPQDLISSFAPLARTLLIWIGLFLRMVYNNVGWLTKTKIGGAAATESTLLTQAVKWVSIIAIFLGTSYMVYKSYNAYQTDKDDIDDRITYP